MKSINVDRFFEIAQFTSAMIILIISASLLLWSIIHPDIDGVSVILFIAGLIFTFSGYGLVRIAYKEVKGTEPDDNPTDEPEGMEAENELIF
ncbi:MAG: hypothetical protein LBK58_08145 [Prevotellaceae bacterium]|jgi:hypothetical protein|nr:hypothetical protein [Prevotellaceae bacterium]